MERIKLSQLEAFYWVATLGSFQAAAAQLRTTQPGISARIKLLEGTLGVQLFDRAARNARLTPKGRALVEQASRMLSLADQVRRDIGEPRAHSGMIRLGAADTVALTWLPRFLSRVRELYPKLDVEIQIDLTVNLARQLGAREIDLAFLAAPVAQADYVQVALCSFPLYWAAGAGYVRESGRLSPHELAEYPVITHTRGSHQWTTVLKWFRDAGAEPRRVSTSSSLASIIRLSAARLGISVQTPAVIARELALGELVLLPTTVALPQLDFFAVFPRSASSGAAQALTELAVTESAPARKPGGRIRKKVSKKITSYNWT
jgi:DNA-binding transcriptional LysR family regulator